MKSTLFYVTLLLLATSSAASSQWIQQQSGVSSLIGGVCFTSSSNGWAVGQNNIILKTTNAGAQWSQVTTSVSDAFYKVAFADSMNGWITGEHNVILSTTNGGNSWQSSIVGSPYDATDYGIFAAKINGQIECWTAGGWASDAYTLIQKLTPYGQFTPEIMGFAGRLVRIDFLNDSLGWAAGDSNLVLKTTNGGLWWNQEKIPPIPNHQGFNDIKFFNPNDGILVGDGGVIMKSTDGGSSWSLVRSSKNDIFFRLALTGDSTAYAVGGVGDSAAVLVSTDQGATWTSQKVGVPSGTWFEDVYFLNDSDGWAVGSNGLIFHTTDGGVGTILNTPLLIGPTTGDTLAAADTALVWNSVPSASSYEVQIALDSSFSNTVLDSKSIADTSLGLKAFFNTVLNPNTKYFWRVKASSTNGISLFSDIWSFIVGTITSVNSPELPKTYSLSQNYPNPFNPTTVINYSLPKRSFVTLTIFDDLGREVQTLVNTEQNAGSYSINFNASSLPSGAYFYRIQAGNYSQTMKLLLLK